MILLEVIKLKIKNAGLEWYVMYYSLNDNKIKRVNILGYNFAKELAKQIKKRKINTKLKLAEHLKTEFMYHYWCKAEYEMVVGGFFHRNEEELEKIDVWYQLELNLNTIVDYINYKMDLKLN